MPSVVVASISAVTAVVIAAITYYTAKEHELEADWRKEKFAQYKEYLQALATMVGEHPTKENRKRYAVAFNTVGLFASQEVISALHTYQELTRLPSSKISIDEHDRLLSELVLAIRRDLKLKPQDDLATFSYKLIAADLNTPESL